MEDNKQQVRQLSEEEQAFLKSYREELKEIQSPREGEKERLYQKAAQGDALAKGRLTEIYLSEVLEIALEYQDREVAVNDLIQEGNIGLMLVLEQLSGGEVISDKEIREAIRQSIEAALEEYEDLKSANDQMVTKVNLLSQGVQNLVEELKRQVTVEDLVGYLNLPREEIEDILRLAGDRIEVGHSHTHEEQTD